MTRLTRDDAVLHRGPLADVEVVEEHVQGRHSLHEALLDVRPLVGRDDARHEVHRERALEARVLAVDRERDARRPERGVAEPLAPSELVGAERPEPEGELAVVGTHLAALVDELVEEALVLIAPEQTRSRLRTLGRPCFRSVSRVCPWDEMRVAR